MKNRAAQANDGSDEADSLVLTETSFREDILTSLSFLSRLPVKVSQRPGGGAPSLANASRAFGIVGLILGALTGVFYWVLSVIGVTPIPAVIMTLALGSVFTGGLHEDGLADTADGFGGGWSVARKLDIMRDSQIGTYGVLALIFSVGFRIFAYGEILGSTGLSPVTFSISSLLAVISLFAAIGCLSRAPIALMMYQMPLARSDGRAAEAGKPSHNTLRSGLFISAVAGAICLVTFTGVGAAIAVFASLALVYVGLRKLANRQIGGYSGDVLGALQQSAEIGCLLALMLFH